VADGAVVFQASADWLDVLNGRVMAYALRAGTATSPVWGNAPVVGPRGGMVAGRGYVSNRNVAGESLVCDEAYAFAVVDIEFSSTCEVYVYNLSGTQSAYVLCGVLYGVYP